MGRCPLRCASLVGLRSPGSSPMRAVGSDSINSGPAAVRMSATELARHTSVPVNS